MAFDLTTQSGRADARKAGNWVGEDSSGKIVMEAAPSQQGSSQAVQQPAVAASPYSQQQQDILAGYKESSGFSREELAEKRRQFDATMAQTQAQWVREGVPLLEIKQRLMALEERKYASDLALAQAAEARQLEGQRATLGLDALKFGSTLGGAADVFQQADYFRGAQAGGQMPTFLNALAQNTPLPTFQAPGAVAPTAQTMGGLAGQLTGTPGTPTGSTPGGYSTDQALSQIGSIFKGGGSGLAAGSLERLDPNELAIMRSGSKKLGIDFDQFLRGYQKSGVGQSAGSV